MHFVSGRGVSILIDSYSLPRACSSLDESLPYALIALERQT